MPGFVSKFPPVALSKGRLEALSDGIFAIVMTLLVLELRVPDLPRHTPQHELLVKLRELGPYFFSFVITFVLAGAFWLLHHITFHYVRHTTRVLVWLNIAFLMFVSLLPFSTGMLGHFSFQPISTVFYFGNQFMLAMLLRIQWAYAQRTKLVDPGTDPEMQQRISTRVNMMMIGHLGAVIMAFFNPMLSVDVFMAAMLLPAIVAKFRSRRANT
jgi:TMEM175 potassium channel family protein